ncbi:hypothetical protein [Paenibacillus sp. J31TS4]|uniref:hypothetical protein n=1 Tax=Paenibacillus sp. J31TS4 TaxID=2807195 RepID=UPI0024BEAE2A|nr:hypothetical protein [Paenibacillus sp. J31TS4]
MEELMQRELDHDLDPYETELMHAHIRQCPECAAWRSRLHRLAEELESLPHVAPPYSVVDSILDRLPDLQGKPPAAAPAAVPPVVTPLAAEEPPAERPASPGRRRRSLYWTTAGGAAACLALGIFLFQNYGDMRQDARGIHEMALSPKAQKSSADQAGSAAKSSGSQSTPVDSAAGSSPAAESSTPGSRDGAVRMLTPDTPASERTPAASAKPPGLLPTTPQPSADTRTLAPSATAFSDAVQNSAAKSKGAPPEGTVSPAASAGDAPATAGPESPARTPGKLLTDAGVPKANETPQPTKGDQGKQTPRESVLGIAGLPEEETPEAGPGAVLTEPGRFPGIAWLPGLTLAPGSGLPDDSAQDKTTAADAAVPAPVYSPQGTHFASAEQQRVVIRDERGQLVFASTHQWADHERIALLGWKQENGFLYEVTRPDGSRQAYFVDLSQKREVPQN